MSYLCCGHRQVLEQRNWRRYAELTRRWPSLEHLDMWTTSCVENILARWVFSRQWLQRAWPDRDHTAFS